MEQKRMEAHYARQSLDVKDSLSIEAQLEKCNTGSSQNVAEYADKGYSGKNTDRPDLQRLIADIQAGKIEKVVVYKLDRISRNINDFYNLYEIMSENKCSFESVSECFDTGNSMGRAMMGILAVFAQMERENTVQRVTDNYYYRIKDGRWAGGPAPYGFRNGRTEKNVPTLLPIPEEIEAVKDIFALYNGAEHLSLQQICNWLRYNNISSRKRKTFDNVTVARILQNPIYAIADRTLYAYYQARGAKLINDENEWNGLTSCHIVGKRKGNVNTRKYTNLKEQTVYLTNIEGVIPSVLFIGVQERLAQNEKIGRANQTYTRFEELAGKLKCGKCGYAIKAYSVSTNGMPYMDCYNNRTLHSCDAKFSSRKFTFYDIQEEVGQQIQTALDEMDDIFALRLAENAIRQEEIDRLHKELKRLIDLAATGDIAADAVQSAIEERQQKIYDLQLEQQLARTSTSVIEVQINENPALRPYGGKIYYEDLMPEQKQEIVKILIDRIYVYENGDIKIKWNF